MKGDLLVLSRTHKQTDRFRAVLEALPFALVLCEEGIIRFANVAMQKLLGAHTPEELVGREFLRFVQQHDSDRIETLVHTDSSSPDDLPSTMVRLIRLDGTELLAEINASLVEGSNAVQIIARRTEGKSRSKELPGYSEATSAFLIDDSLDAVFTTTPEGNILEMNKSGRDLLGLVPNQIVGGLNFTTQFCADPRQRDMLVLAINRQGFIKNFEYEVKRTDGSKRLVLENAIALRDADGKINAVRSTLRDITEWKLLEQQIFQARKMESIAALVGSIAHDFINVLNNLSGFSGQLKKHPDDAGKVARYADAMEKSTGHGLGLAKQLMSFVRRKNLLSSSAFVEDVLSEIEMLTETFPKNILITIHADLHLPSVAAEAGELYQALMNICLNARDAMPVGGTLRIEASQYVPAAGEPLFVGVDDQPREFVRIRISDSGTGIPAHIKDRIFDPFFTTKGRGGTGLGLTIVYNIVKSYKGVITVESESNRGSVFNIYLPVAEVQATGRIPQQQLATKSSNNELILLVDDEPMMQELGSEMLREQGYRVMVARDGVEAVEMYQAQTNEIALVILDLLMPRLDGGETYLQLKKINKNVKAFFCTGYSPEEVIGPLLAKESLTALHKPFRPEEFIQTVRDILSAN